MSVDYEYEYAKLDGSIFDDDLTVEGDGNNDIEIKEKQPKQSKVFRPNHYTKYTIDPITFIMLNNLPFDVGNVIKYVCRFEDKDGIQDLKKARRYLEMMIEVRENRKEYLPEKGCL